MSQQHSPVTNKLPLYVGLVLWLIATVFYGLDYLQHTLPSVLLSPIAHNAHLSTVDVADILSLYFPVYALAQLPAGYLLDRFGLVILSPAALLVSLGLLCMLIPSPFALTVGRILIGMGSACAFLGALKAAANYLPQGLFPIFVGLIQAVGVLGGLLGQVLIEYLVKFRGVEQALYNAVRDPGRRKRSAELPGPFA